MSDKKSGSKENLTWKINYLAAQVGEKTHMKTAMIAASRTKYQKIHNNDGTELNPTAIKQELLKARKLKLEHKLHQARKDVKQALKKAKVAETQKQIKKIKAAKKSLEEEKDEKPGKKVTQQDLEQYEKELDVLKSIDLDLLVDKVLKNKIEKNSALKTEEILKEILESLSPKKLEDQTSQDIGSRLMSNKLVLNEVSETISAFQHILKGNNEKIEKRKVEEQEKKKKEEKKRKSEEEKKKNTTNKKPRISSSSEFMETLGGGSITDDENEDENFKTIYEGAKKPNRAGQRQRRKQWEEKYGREANHVVAEYQKREEKRLQNPDYRPKKKPATKPQANNNNNNNSKANAEPMHPSWEAKKLQQEMMSKALSGKGPSNNNKIVFDDSD